MIIPPLPFYGRVIRSSILNNISPLPLVPSSSSLQTPALLSSTHP